MNNKKEQKMIYLWDYISLSLWKNVFSSEINSTQSSNHTNTAAAAAADTQSKVLEYSSFFGNIESMLIEQSPAPNVVRITRQHHPGARLPWPRLKHTTTSIFKKTAIVFKSSSIFPKHKSFKNPNI